MYDNSWVEKLYRGFSRNTTYPFEFVCYTDKIRDFEEPDIKQILLKDDVPGYGSCIQPYELGTPMILVGLDTIVVGNIDHLIDYCFEAEKYALPRDPYKPSRACNGVALIPWGHHLIAELHSGENDMDWVRRFPHNFIDDLWPGHVLSYKGTVKKIGLGDARIVYFHGEEKPHQLSQPWIEDNWR